MVPVFNTYDRSQHHLLQVDFISLLKYYWKRFPLKGDICVKPCFALGHGSLSLDLQRPTPRMGGLRLLGGLSTLLHPEVTFGGTSVRGRWETCTPCSSPSHLVLLELIFVLHVFLPRNMCLVFKIQIICKYIKVKHPPLLMITIVSNSPGVFWMFLSVLCGSGLGTWAGVGCRLPRPRQCLLPDDLRAPTSRSEQCTCNDITAWLHFMFSLPFFFLTFMEESQHKDSLLWPLGRNQCFVIQ